MSPNVLNFQPSRPYKENIWQTSPQVRLYLPPCTDSTLCKVRRASLAHSKLHNIASPWIMHSPVVKAWLNIYGHKHPSASMILTANCCRCTKSCLILLWPHRLACWAPLFTGFPKQEFSCHFLLQGIVSYIGQQILYHWVTREAQNRKTVQQNRKYKHYWMKRY